MKALVLVIASLSLAGCAPKTSGAPDCEAPIEGSHSGPRIVAFGDSQTAGFMTPSSAGCGFSFANILSVSEGRRLDNEAVPGSVLSSEAELGLILEYQFKSTDEVLALVGFNDVRLFKSEPEHLAQFKLALAEALEYMSPKVSNIRMGTTLESPLIDQGAVAAYRSAIHEVVDSLALPNVRVIDPSPSLTFGPDGLHLNLAGQQGFAAQMEL